jgi:hypothetical protein
MVGVGVDGQCGWGEARTCLRGIVPVAVYATQHTVSLSFLPLSQLETIQRRNGHQGKEEKEFRPRLGGYVHTKGQGMPSIAV